MTISSLINVYTKLEEPNLTTNLNQTELHDQFLTQSNLA